MEIEEFIKNFELQFDDVEPGTLAPESEFQNMEEWSSLNALLIIAMVDANYNVKINLNEIQSARTITDVFDIVKSKKQ